MRDAFPYETNGLLIRHILVPDPLDEETWKALEERWQLGTREMSLIEWIIESGALSGSELKRALADATGKRVLDSMIRLRPEEMDPAANVLENNEFLVGRDLDGRKVVAGGTSLAPDLREYIGDKSEQWEWIVLNPRRHEMYEVKPEDRPGEGVSDSQPPLGRRLESILLEACAEGVCDIHFERYGDRLRIRSKVNAGMRDLGTWNEPECTESLRILKRKANLSTAATSLPQDGRLEVWSGRGMLSFRVSHIHAVNGESLVLRLTGRESGLPPPAGLGLPGSLVSVLTDILLYGQGMVVCTGSTGSGKTTTMCSLVSSLKEHPLKILTIEDPVEYDLSNATQCNVNPATNWTFPLALKAFLRQDPDIIMVGEIRDEQSAAIACRAGLTGHCVLTSLHAHSPVGALDRLCGWGLAPGMIAESVSLITHQKLLDKPSGNGRTARFSWIKARAGEIYDYLTRGEFPPHWITSGSTVYEEDRSSA